MDSQQIRLDELNRLSNWIAQQSFHQEFKKRIAMYVIERVKEIVCPEE
jgi:hypothetical protein